MGVLQSVVYIQKAWRKYYSKNKKPNNKMICDADLELGEDDVDGIPGANSDV